MPTLPHDPEAGLSGFDKELSENSVEYLLFVIDKQSDARALLAQLEALRKAALELCRSLTKDYIWQRDEFNLELKNERGKCICMRESMEIFLADCDIGTRTGVSPRSDRLWRRSGG